MDLLVKFYMESKCSLPLISFFLEPIYDVIGEPSAATTEDQLVFNSEVGANVELSNGRCTATRIRYVVKSLCMTSTLYVRTVVNI